jgi:hypothetical protein
MKNTAQSKIFRKLFFVVLMVGMGIVLPSPLVAEVSVIIHNDTGYHLGEVKYVQEIGDATSLVGLTQQLNYGGQCTFKLQGEGTYRVYASLVMGGIGGSRKVYAKGKASSLRDGRRYRITLRKIMAIQRGSGLRFIDQKEFDAIK